MLTEKDKESWFKKFTRQRYLEHPSTVIDKIFIEGKYLIDIIESFKKKILEFMKDKAAAKVILFMP